MTQKIINNIIIILLTLGVTHVFAQDFSSLEKYVFSSESGGQLPYRLLKPQNYNPENKYPLVVFLHGSGERGDDNEAQLKHGITAFLNEEVREKYPAFVLVPQCPQDMRWATSSTAYGEPFTLSEAPTEPMKTLLELIQQMQTENSIDVSRLYLTGLSMGGYGTYDLLSRNPDMFAAAIPVCGYGDIRMAEKFAHIPLWIFHGEEDEVVPVDLSRVMVNALESVGAKPKYTEYPAVGHDSWENAYQEEKLMAWLFKKKKR